MSKRAPVDDKSVPLDPTAETTNEQQQQEEQQQQQQIQIQQQQESSTIARTSSSSKSSNNNEANSGGGIIQDDSIRITSSINNSLDRSSNNTSDRILSLTEAQQRKAEMMADEDPLLISQSLTYVTDDGGTLHTFHSSPFSMGT